MFFPPQLTDVSWEYGLRFNEAQCGVLNSLLVIGDVALSQQGIG